MSKTIEEILATEARKVLHDRKNGSKPLTPEVMFAEGAWHILNSMGDKAVQQFLAKANQFHSPEILPSDVIVSEKTIDGGERGEQVLLRIATAVIIPIAGMKELKKCQIGITRGIPIKEATDSRRKIEIRDGCKWITKRLGTAFSEMVVDYGKEKFHIDSSRLTEVVVIKEGVVIGE